MTVLVDTKVEQICKEFAFQQMWINSINLSLLAKRFKSINKKIIVQIYQALSTPNSNQINVRSNSVSV